MLRTITPVIDTAELVKVSVAVTHEQRLLVGARSFLSNLWDGHTPAEKIEQSTILLEDLGVEPKQVIVDLGYRRKDVDAADAEVQTIHRGRYKTMGKHERQLLKRRQAVEHRSSTLWSRFRRFSAGPSFQIKDLRALCGIFCSGTFCICGIGMHEAS